MRQPDNPSWPSFKDIVEEGRPADALMAARELLETDRQLAMNLAAEKILNTILGYMLVLGKDDTMLVVVACVDTLFDGFANGMIDRKLSRILDGIAEAQERGVSLWQEDS